MRARNIKPGFYKNEDLAECSVWARLLAPGLWMMADREGRLEDRPKRIKGEIFPYDNVDVELLLQELDRWGHIKRYEVAGERYVQILTFLDHQKPHVREKDSIIPPYQAAETAPRQQQECHNTEEIPNQGDGEAQPRHCQARPESLNPESLNDESLSLRSRGGASQNEAALPEPPRKEKKSSRGTRLDPDWDLPIPWGEWAEKQGMTQDAIIRECDKFKDWWLAKSGKDATKTDWFATWRNWIRRHLEDYAK